MALIDMHGAGARGARRTASARAAGVPVTRKLVNAASAGAIILLAAFGMLTLVL